MYFFFFKAEDGIRDVAVTGVQTCALPISNSLSPPFAGVSMRTVLHQGNTAVASDFAQTIEIGWVSAHMYRNDGFCPLGNAGFNQVGIDAVRIRQDIYHDRESSGEQDGAGRRDKGEVGNDDFIAAANIEG